VRACVNASYFLRSLG